MFTRLPMVIGFAQLFYGFMTILYLYAISRNYPLLAGRRLYDRLTGLIGETKAIWLLRSIAFSLIVAGVIRLV